jgi:hypothetical protein
VSFPHVIKNFSLSALSEKPPAAVEPIQKLLLLTFFPGPNYLAFHTSNYLIFCFFILALYSIGMEDDSYDTTNIVEDAVEQKEFIDDSHR